MKQKKYLIHTGFFLLEATFSIALCMILLCIIFVIGHTILEPIRAAIVYQTAVQKASQILETMQQSHSIIRKPFTDNKYEISVHTIVPSNPVSMQATNEQLLLKSFQFVSIDVSWKNNKGIKNNYTLVGGVLT